MFAESFAVDFVGDDGDDGDEVAEFVVAVGLILWVAVAVEGGVACWLYFFGIKF